jgi:hypothetical protein
MAGEKGNRLFGPLPKPKLMKVRPTKARLRQAARNVVGLMMEKRNRQHSIVSQPKLMKRPELMKKARLRHPRQAPKNVVGLKALPAVPHQGPRSGEEKL